MGVATDPHTSGWRSIRQTLLVILMCLPCLHAALASPYTVEAKHPSSLDGTPGAIIHLAFLVHNDSAETRQFKDQLQVPKGWHPVLPTGQFEVPARGHQLRLVSVQLSASAPAGPAEIHYLLTDLISNKLQNLATQVDVAETDDLTLTWQVPPAQWLFQNHTETLRVLLANTGNTVQQLAVSLDAASGLQGTVSDQSLVLNPGDQHVLSIDITAILPNHNQRFHGRPSLAMVVTSANTQYRLAHRFDALITHADVDLYLRLPMRLHVALTRHNGDWTWEQAISGSGHVDEAKRHHLSFLLRRDHPTSFTQQDGFRQVMKYQGPKAEVVVGDFAMSLSPLTDSGRLGRGIAVRSGTHKHSLRVGLHSVQTEDHVTRAVELRTRLGSTVRHQLGLSTTRAATAALNNADDVKRRWASSLLRSQAEQPHQWQFEWAGSRAQDGLAKLRQGQAWHFQSHGPLTPSARWVYHLSGWQIGHDFAHPLHGSSARQADFSGPVHNRLRLRLYWHQQHWQSRAMSTMSNQRLGAQLTSLLQPNWRTELGVQWQSGQSDQRAGFITHLGLRRDWPKGSLSWRFEGRDGRISGRTVSARYRPKPSFSLTLQDRLRTNSLDDLSLTDRRLSGRWLTLQWRPMQPLSLQVSYAERVRQSGLSNPLDTEPPRQQSHGLRARLDHTISHHQDRRHHWWLETRRHQDALGHRDRIIQVGWSKMWHTPIRRQRNMGSLHGTITPTPSQAVRIHVAGRSTLSDPSGHFSIPALPSGPHPVRIDRSSLPPGLVVAAPAGLIADINAGGSNHLNIALMEGASIHGQIALVESAWQGLERLPPMLISLSHADHHQHTVSDEAGRFVFDSLQAGSWTLEINAAQWPAGHHINNPIQTMTLAEGERRQMNLLLIPDQRSIEFIDEGHLHE